MSRPTLFLGVGVLLALAVAVKGIGIVFPGYPISESKDSCNLPSGGKGTCKIINECEVAAQNLDSQNLRDCGLQGKVRVVCCPQEPVQSVDLSPPPMDFECGVEYTTSSSTTSSSTTSSSTTSSSTSINFASTCSRTYIPQARDLPNLPDCLSFFQCANFGTEVRNNKYPWMALLGEDTHNWYCSGVLINRRWVLTAAHCPNRYNIKVVRLGEHDFTRYDDGGPNGGHEDFNVAEVVFYGDYKLPAQYHDISLIKLATPINKWRQESMNPVCLPWGNEADLPLEGINVTVSGWGITNTSQSRSELSPFLNEIDVTVLPIDVCSSSYSKHTNDFIYNYPQDLGEETLCIGDISNEKQVKDSCPGDSGGPAIVKRDEHSTLVGIVSAGVDCGKKIFPGLYVNIQYPKHLAWIKKVAFPICDDSMCENGACNPSVGCECFTGWSGRLCDTPICDHSCGQGSCVLPNYCDCICPWYGDHCENLFCLNGNSFDGLTCTCDVGWSGKLCELAICDPGCVHGWCESPGICECSIDWRGAGWQGNQCQETLCLNGNSSSDGLTCTCDVGWKGSFCGIPVCDPECVNGHGNCDSPATCKCYTGWHGNQCQDSKCDPECGVNAKWCTNSGTCECEFGWHGNQCQDKLQCHEHDDYFEIGNECFFFLKDDWQETWTWDGGQARCKGLGGFIAEPNNLTIFQEAVRENLNLSILHVFGTWIGAIKGDDNVWIWSSDGTKVGNTENWSSKSNYRECANVAELHPTITYRSCENKLAYVMCEFRHQ